MNSPTVVAALLFLLLGSVLFSLAYWLHANGVAHGAQRKGGAVQASQDPWLEDMRNQVDQNRPLSRWYSTADLRAYLRFGTYHLSAPGIPFLRAVGVSNVSLVHPEDAGKGIFKAFIVRLEEQASLCGYEVIQVEQVHDPVLRANLLKHGYLYWEPGKPLAATPYEELGPTMVKHLAPTQSIYASGELDIVPEPGDRCMTHSYGLGTIEEVGNSAPFLYVRVRPDMVDGKPGYPMNFAPENVSIFMADGSLVRLRSF